MGGVTPGPNQRLCLVPMGGALPEPKGGARHGSQGGPPQALGPRVTVWPGPKDRRPQGPYPGPKRSDSVDSKGEDLPGPKQAKPWGPRLGPCSRALGPRLSSPRGPRETFFQQLDRREKFLRGPRGGVLQGTSRHVFHGPWLKGRFSPEPTGRANPGPKGRNLPAPKWRVPQGPRQG